MQISSIVADRTATSAELGLTPPPGLAKVFARYNLTAITATEIDWLVDELRELGLQDTPFLLELESRGSRFRSMVAQNLSACGIGRNLQINNSAPINLIEVVKQQIEIAKQEGNKTAFTERYLAKLEGYMSIYFDTRAPQPSTLRRARARAPRKA
jgi:hypothetical protein